MSQYLNTQVPLTFESAAASPQQVKRATVAPQRYGVAVNKLNANLQGLEKDLFTKLQQQKEEEVAEKKEKRKRNIKAVGLTLATVLGVAFIGNRSSNTMARLGQKADDLLLSKSWYKNFEKSCGKVKSKIKNFFLKNDNKFIRESAEDIAETYKNRHATNKLKIANGYGRGFESIFSLTPPDIIKQSLMRVNEQDPAKAVKSIEKLVGKDKAQHFYNQIFGKNGIENNSTFCKELTDAIAENFGAKNNGKIDTKKLLKIFEDMQKGSVNGVNLSEFTNIKMNQNKDISGRIMSNWSSVNLVDSIGEKIAKHTGNKWKGFCRGNLGDALVKVNAVNGSLAETKLGSFVQNCITLPSESISNFVNDKSNIGIGLSALIFMLYQNMQKAPKEQKVATVMDDYAGTLGSLAIATPLAFGATYKLATLGNLKGKTKLTRILKYPGKLFNLGLKQYDKNGKLIAEAGKKGFFKTLKNGSGHLFRFALIMFGFTGLFMKPISALIHKIFGKPYDPMADEEAKAQKKAAERAEVQELYELYTQALAQAQAQEGSI